MSWILMRISHGRELRKLSKSSKMMSFGEKVPHWNMVGSFVEIMPAIGYTAMKMPQRSFCFSQLGYEDFLPQLGTERRFLRLFTRVVSVPGKGIVRSFVAMVIQRSFPALDGNIEGVLPLTNRDWTLMA